MSRLRRILAWALFLGLLTAIGVGVFHVVRYRPRCVITGPLVVRHLAPDGSRLATLKMQRFPLRTAKIASISKICGPLQIWDTRSGQIVFELLDASPVHLAKSPDGRHIAASHENGSFYLVDWQQGRQWRIDGIAYAHHQLAFSPKGQWLHVCTKPQEPNLFINVATRAVEQQLLGDFLQFHSDDRRVLMRQRTNGSISITDLNSETASFELPPETWQFRVVPDGKHLVVWMNTRTATEAAADDDLPKEWARGLFLWDVEGGRMKHRFDLDQHGERVVTFSPDHRLMATWPGRQYKEGMVEIVEVATGRRLWSDRVICPIRGAFSADGSLYCFQHGFERHRMTMFDLASGRRRWERDGRWADHAQKVGVVFLNANAGEWGELADANTGTTLALSPPNFRTWDEKGKIGFRPIWTPDDAAFAIRGWTIHDTERSWWRDWLVSRWPELFAYRSEGVLVMETTTGQERFRAHNCGGDYFLSDDARTLVTVDAAEQSDGVNVIRIWDVRPTRAWIWAMRSAILTGMGLWVMRWMWRRRQSRLAAASPAPGQPPLHALPSGS